MIRAVFDTNIVISGSLWSGSPHLVMQTALDGLVKPIISEAMLDELKDVIERPKFAGRLALLGKTVPQVVEDYLRIAEVIEVEVVEPTITLDPDDDQVLACALSGGAAYIVSGDPHLLDTRAYKNIPILGASDFLVLLEMRDDETDGK
jgi:uncharacterized protein